MIDKTENMAGQKEVLPQFQNLTPYHKLEKLVENRTVFSMSHCELNIFETFRKSERVSLKFDHLVFTTMLRGKKVMNLFDNQRFDYLPGESVVVPSNEEMLIDFPEATYNSPSQCIALTIDDQNIKETLDILNEKFTKAEDKDSWSLDPKQFHIQNTAEIAKTVDRIIHISRENNSSRDIFANLAVKELLIRLMQTQARKTIFTDYLKHASSNRFAYIVKYIKENIAENLRIDRLSNLACMSKPHFFRSFKQEFGITPVEFILRERIDTAKRVLGEPDSNITDAAFRTGFQSISYFCSVFKKLEGITPNDYKKALNPARLIT